MKNSALCLMVAICIIICSINLCITTQIQRDRGETEKTTQSEDMNLSEETRDYISEEESTEDIIVEDYSADETSDDISEDADKHLMSVPTPDIITNLNVKLYNKNHPDYIADAEIYFEDIYYYLFKYAPDSMWISAAMAQAYTEGGAGKSGIYTRTNNCFGIMAGSNWEGYVYSRTHGMVFKDYSTARQYGASGLFRAYESIEESVKDYVDLIQNGRYTSALNTLNPYSYLSVLLANGYGESHMLNTWTQVINKFNLTQYDRRY